MPLRISEPAVSWSNEIVYYIYCCSNQFSGAISEKIQKNEEFPCKNIRSSPLEASFEKGVLHANFFEIILPQQ